MLSTRSYPRAIVHFDADSFFASVEQSLDHTLRGKVVVTGGERGAATSVSIEGKKMGLSLTFDDARLTQIDKCIPLLDKYGVNVVKSEPIDGNNDVKVLKDGSV